MSSLHRLELQQKIFLLNSISNLQISFLVSYSFDIETVNTFKHSCCFLTNHTRDSRGDGHPDPEIRLGLKKHFFRPFGPQFCLKMGVDYRIGIVFQLTLCLTRTKVTG